MVVCSLEITVVSSITKEVILVINVKTDSELDVFALLTRLTGQTYTQEDDIWFTSPLYEAYVVEH